MMCPENASCLYEVKPSIMLIVVSVIDKISFAWWGMVGLIYSDPLKFARFVGLTGASYTYILPRVTHCVVTAVCVCMYDTVTAYLRTNYDFVLRPPGLSS